MQQLFNPMDIRDASHRCNVAADHEAVLQSTNSQWNNRSHSNFGNKNLQIATKWRGEIPIETKGNSVEGCLEQFQSRVYIKRGLKFYNRGSKVYMRAGGSIPRPKLDSNRIQTDPNRFGLKLGAQARFPDTRIFRVKLHSDNPKNHSTENRNSRP